MSGFHAILSKYMIALQSSEIWFLCHKCLGSNTKHQLKPGNEVSFIDLFLEFRVKKSIYASEDEIIIWNLGTSALACQCGSQDCGFKVNFLFVPSYHVVVHIRDSTNCILLGCH